MTVEYEVWIEIDKIVSQVLQLSKDFKKSLEGGVYGEDDLQNALVTLMGLETGLYGKLATIFKSRTTSKIVEFASIARLLLESHATICWILDSEGSEQTRGTQFMETGWDLQKHYNNLTSRGYGLTQRTRSRLPTTETRMKTMGVPEMVNWYDELNFYVHPSAAIMTQHLAGGLQKTIDFGIWIAGNIYADSILKIAKQLDTPDSVAKKANIIHSLDIPENEVTSKGV